MVAYNKKKSEKITVTSGNVHITTTFNNIHIVITNTRGDVLTWGTAGRRKFKGGKKSTPYAGQKCAEAVVEEAIKRYKINNIIYLYCKGPGAGKEPAIRTICQTLKVQTIKDITPVPHGGCRPRKKRRV